MAQGPKLAGEHHQGRVLSTPGVLTAFDDQGHRGVGAQAVVHEVQQLKKNNNMLG